MKANVVLANVVLANECRSSVYIHIDYRFVNLKNRTVGLFASHREPFVSQIILPCLCRDNHISFLSR